MPNVYNRFTGEAWSPAGFVMLEGLTPGRNWIGRIRFSWLIRSSVSVETAYEMRKPESAAAIHTLRLALTARFD